MTTLSPRPGSLQDRLIRKYGEFWGGKFFLNGIAWGVAFILLLFFGLVILCTLVVAESASYVSDTLYNFFPISASLGVLLFFFFLWKVSNSDFLHFLNQYFKLQVVISILTFMQVIFWVIDTEHSNIHEPRFALLAVIAALLAFFQKQFTVYIQKLIGPVNSNPEFINPNTNTLDNISNFQFSHQNDLTLSPQKQV